MKYRFSPTEEQKQPLARTFGCCRFVYNWALRKKTDAYYKDGIRLCYKDLSEAFLNFFEGRGASPPFKKKRNRPAATYSANAFSWRDGNVTLAKMSAPLA